MGGNEKPFPGPNPGARACEESVDILMNDSDMNCGLDKRG